LVKKKRLIPSAGPARFLLPAFAAASVLLLAAQAPSLYKRLTCSFQVQQEEAVNVEFARILHRGDILYSDLAKGGPYIHCSYPPLFPWLQSLAMDFIDGVWAPGRTLAFLGYLGCGLLFAYTAWRRWKNPYWTILLPSLLWLSPTWAAWGTMVRLDTCLQALNMASFLILWKVSEPFHPEWKQKTGSSYAIAGLLNAAAILMKPTALTVTLAFILFALFRRQKREAAIFLACSLGPVLILAGVAQGVTGGMFWAHAVTGTAVGFNPDQLFHYLGKGLLPEAGWIVAGIGLTFWMKRFSLLLRCQLLLSVLSLGTLSRYGAAENYFMEFLWVGLLVVGEGWAGCRLVRTAASFGGGRRAEVLRHVPAVLLVAGLISYSRFQAPLLPSAQVMEEKAGMLGLYHQDGEHFALDVDLPVMAGKKVWYQPTGVLAVETTGVWDPAPLLEDIRRKKFSTIELYDLPKQYLVTERVERAIRENYKPVLRRYGRVWLAPK
jgi:hypothetical protein